MLALATAGAGAAVSEALDGDKAMTADEAARQIDRGLMLWEQHPRALLDWHWKGRPGWKPAYYRWNS